MDNEFNTAINYLKGLLTDDPDITIVTHGASNDIDMDKESTYPLAHIEYLSFDPLAQLGMVSFTFEIHILKIRVESKTPFTDKWLRNDNELANYNTTANIVNRLFGHLNNNPEIPLLSNTKPEAVSLAFLNLLDGYSFQIELGITNETVYC